jgi:hypothetical protein
VSAFWIFPFNILVRAANPAASAFVTAFITYLHPRSFPLIYLGWAKYCTNFIRTLGHANVMIKNGKMGLCVTLKPEKILFFLNILR